LAWVHGAVYAAFVPPWQAPDESVHYQYLIALAATPDPFPDFVLLSPEVYQAVFESQLRHRFWDYSDWATPDTFTPMPAGQEYLGRAAGIFYRLAIPVLWLVDDAPIEDQLSALRMYAVLWLVLTAAVTYALAREVFPDAGGPESVYPLAAAAVVAIFPQYVFIAASFNDDNLVPALAGLVLLCLLRLARARSGRVMLGWWALALLVGALAVLTKRTGAVAAGLAFLGGLILLVRIWQSGGTRRRLGVAVVVATGLGAVIALGYLLIFPPILPVEVANWLRVDADALVRLASDGRVAFSRPWQAWYPQVLFLTLSFWGWFGYLKAPLSLAVISLVRYASVLVVAGVALSALVLAWRGWNAPLMRFQLGGLGLFGLALGAQLALIVAQHVIEPAVYSFTGRYLFPFISAFAILTVWGWSAWWPARWKAGGVVLGLGLLVMLDMYAWIGVMLPFWYS
jgi:4-amino-4-deoxy-L-arabinose transferase-like glycosyltransferase